jgi:hypothetical protein
MKFGEERIVNQETEVEVMSENTNIPDSELRLVISLLINNAF